MRNPLIVSTVISIIIPLAFLYTEAYNLSHLLFYLISFLYMVRTIIIFSKLCKCEGLNIKLSYFVLFLYFIITIIYIVFSIISLDPDIITLTCFYIIGFILECYGIKSYVKNIKEYNRLLHINNNIEEYRIVEGEIASQGENASIEGQV